MLVLMVTALVPGSADGKTWTLAGRKEFSEGELDGVSLLSTGEMVLAPVVQPIPGLKANYVWDISFGPEGAAFVGTGAPAAVYRWHEGELDLLHETSEEHVQSVLGMADGSVLAATAPRGIIYRVTETGEVTIFADLAAQYVWDMARGPDGGVYCATGPGGSLIKLTSEGEAEELFSTGKGNLMCLAVDSAGEFIYAGTEPSGVIYRLNQAGEATVLYDAEESEVHALLLSQQGEIYAGTAQADGQAARLPAAGAQAQKGAAPQVSTPPASGSPQGRGKPTPPNSVYRLLPGHGGMRIAQLQNAMALSLALTAANEVLVGTGSDGRLIGVSERGVTRVVLSFRAQHVSAIEPDAAGRVLIGTANGGGLWQLLEGHSPEATYRSKVYDAGYLSRWSRLEWKGQRPEKTSVKVALRTGNTRRPDSTWSEWSERVADPQGAGIDVPMGRFAQMKVDLATEDENLTPSFLQAAASFRQANRRPRIQNLMLDGQDGTDNRQKGPSAQRSGQPEPKQSSTRTIVWKASDPNGDELTFHLYYRGIEERQWKKLETDIRGRMKHKWETRRVPDGDYVVRLVAEDTTARPPEERLQMEKVTSPFVIDNGRPILSALEHSERKGDGGYLLSGRVRDEGSAVARIQVSHNAGDWAPVFARDGIFDSGQEAFDYRTGGLESGEHVFVFAATDHQGNVGSEKIVVQVP
jgi:hypothetical protein